MAEALVLVGGLVVVLGWQYALYRSAGRLWRPLWCAFSLTFVALVYLVPALFGYHVPLQNPVFEQRVTFVGHVVGAQVKYGLLTGACSLPFWWLGL